MRILPLILLLPCLAAASGGKSAAVVDSEFVFENAPYPSCHASTLVQASSGEILAAWFGGSAESRPDVCIYLSRRQEGGWSEPVRVAEGLETGGVQLACWNPVLFQPRGGPLMLFYKVGPSPERWWGMLKTSADGGRSWGPAQRLPPGVLGPIKNKPVQLGDGTLLCGSSVEAPGGGWLVHLERTADLGATWEIGGPLDGGGRFNSIQPAILTYPDGRLQLLCRSREKLITTSWSRDRGRTWAPLEPSGLFCPNSGIDAVSLADGRQLLVYNWREHAGGGPADPGWGARWPLNVAVSRDGVRWDMVLTLESEPSREGYAYPAVIQAGDGLVHVTYTWNRRRIKHVVLDPARL